MKIKIKKLNRAAVIPSYAKDGDAGLDLTAVGLESVYVGDSPTHRIKVKFGIAVEIPRGYVGLVFPRSSVYKNEARLSNSVGVIDSGYRGEISVVLDLDAATSLFRTYRAGDRCAQLIIMPYPHIEFDEVDELTPSERGVGGYGSTGV